MLVVLVVVLVVVMAGCFGVALLVVVVVVVGGWVPLPIVAWLTGAEHSSTLEQKALIYGPCHLEKDTCIEESYRLRFSSIHTPTV